MSSVNGGPYFIVTSAWFRPESHKTTESRKATERSYNYGEDAAITKDIGGRVNYRVYTAGCTDERDPFRHEHETRDFCRKRYQMA